MPGLWAPAPTGVNYRPQVSRSQENRRVFRAFALAASSSRSFGGVCASRESRKVLVATVMASTALRKAASLAFEGLWKPLTLRTNCSEAARISSSVAGGSKLKSTLMFLHIHIAPISSGYVCNAKALIVNPLPSSNHTMTCDSSPGDVEDPCGKRLTHAVRAGAFPL